MKTDIVIVGGGPGGYNTAIYAAKHGLSVVLVEEHRLGGTCLNVGCIPTKALAHDARMSVLKGLMSEEKRKSFQEAMRRKDSIVEQLVGGVSTLLRHPGITVVQGKAVLESSTAVRVEDTVYEAEHIIIATGSEAALPPIPGIDSPQVLTSTEILHLEELPSSVCIIGAGVIGMEFAYILNAFGCAVTVVEYLKECLPALDADIAKRLRKQLEKQGVKFHLQSSVQQIVGGKVVFSSKDKDNAVEADRVLVATGRRARLEGLNLACADVVFTHKGIEVDDRMCTNQPTIYAIGDCNARQMLAHAAVFQGYRAVNSILGKSDTIRLDVMPAAIFTHPEAACVGLTEEAAVGKGIKAVTYKAFHRANGRAWAMDETEGMIKLVAEEDGRIIGCHAFGAESVAMVQEISVLMNKDCTVEQLADMIHIHPTLSEMLQEAVH